MINFKQMAVQFIFAAMLMLISTVIFAKSERMNNKAWDAKGVASWYGRQFHGRKTASGQRFNMHAMTAAHRTLPFGSIVKVSDPSTGKSVIVKITDRGPYHGRRIIDLSRGAAQKLGIIRAGTAKIHLTVIRRGYI